MSWLNFFQTTQKLRHSFGRGINAHIAENEEELFTQSAEAFENDEILKAYELFFQSLINFTDEISNENIIYTKRDESLEFTIFQGCARIQGKITKKSLYAESIITKKKDANVALKRYILERNYQLTYANYFTNDEYIMLKLYHDNITMSPQKVFFPLREITLNADYDKEHIKSEFVSSTLEDISHVIPLETDELQIKYQKLQEWIEMLENKVLTLPSNDNASMQSFLYLNLLFKIDYLLVPKYTFYQELSKMLLDYFSEQESTLEAKNEEVRRYILTLKELSFETFKENFYNAKYTFNPIEKTPFDEISTFISDSLTKIRWFRHNRYTQIIPTIYTYIAFYILYNYGLNPPLQELLHLLVRIQNASFFKALDYELLYDANKNSFSKRIITTQIDDIIANHRTQYKSLESFSSELNFNSLNEFSNSYYIQIQALNFEEI